MAITSQAVRVLFDYALDEKGEMVSKSAAMLKKVVGVVAGVRRLLEIAMHQVTIHWGNWIRN